MRKLYDKVAAKLDTLDFSRIYPGFHRFRFALYDEKTIWLEEKEIPQQNFYGNTTVVFEGEQIAIWKITKAPDSYDIDIFTAGIVHEMFHAFQKECRMDTDAPSDLKLLQYPMDEKNFLVKQAENELLAASVHATVSRQAAIYQTILASRALRRAHIGDFVDEEERIEKWEGQAECSGTLALKQLAYEKYERRLDDYAALLTAGDNLFDIRRNAYFSGTLMCILARGVYNKTCETAKRLAETQTSHEKRFTDFFAGGTTRIPAEGFICGYDPMNQIRLGNRLLATEFIMLQINGETIRIPGPVVVELMADSPNLTTAYFIQAPK
jgi:hypothetical protein